MERSSRKHGANRGLPRQWLFTDERLGGESPADPLWRAIGRLPVGAGIIFRHYGWAAHRRRALFARVLAIARKRRLLVVADGSLPADGLHLRAQHRHRMAGRARGPVTASAHSGRELRRAFMQGADIVFLSPVFATATHPGAPTLGPVRFALVARAAPGPVLALGGMTAARAQAMAALGAAGFGGIDCWAAPARASSLALRRSTP